MSTQGTAEKRVTPCRAAFLRWCKRRNLPIETWGDNGGNLWEAWRAAWAAGRRR